MILTIVSFGPPYLDLFGSGFIRRLVSRLICRLWLVDLLLADHWLVRWWLADCWLVRWWLFIGRATCIPTVSFWRQNFRLLPRDKFADIITNRRWHQDLFLLIIILQFVNELCYVYLCNPIFEIIAVNFFFFLSDYRYFYFVKKR